MRRWALAGLGVLVAALTAVAAYSWLPRPGGGEEQPVVLPQSPMPGRLVVGFQDDASLRWASDRAQMLDRVQQTGASVIRTIVVWEAAAPQPPADPANPFDPAYRLDDVDDLARSAQQRGVELLITIWGTPSWANGEQTPNHPPTDPHALETFSQALADRYSGRHAGYPAVRLFSAWNEPNLEQFLAPQFDAAGSSVGPALYAELARAVYDGVKRGNPDALAAIGETSPRGHDVPSRGSVQDSHSPARFARLLAEEADLRFDAWAQHPYPPRSDFAPTATVRWPRVGLSNLDRFGESLDDWFGRSQIPIWITEYGHETSPADPLGIAPELQAGYAAEALAAASSSGSSSGTSPEAPGRAGCSTRTARRSRPSSSSARRHRGWTRETPCCPPMPRSHAFPRSSSRTARRQATRSRWLAPARARSRSRYGSTAGSRSRSRPRQPRPYGCS
jgi:Cellulase (glycosyl hydrolase family 5)